MIRRFKTPDRTFSFEDGTYGPRHDPYSFREITVAGRGTTVMIHMGIGCRLEVDKVIFPEGGDLATAEFERIVGLSPRDCEGLMDKVEARRYRFCPESYKADQALMRYAV